jgi:hypothetical protein
VTDITMHHEKRPRGRPPIHDRAMTAAERQQRRRDRNSAGVSKTELRKMAAELGFAPTEQPRFRRELLTAVRAIERALKVSDGDPCYVNTVPKVRWAWRNITIVMRRIDRMAAKRRAQKRRATAGPSS